MDAHFRAVYAIEVQRQCAFALQAIGSVNHALSQAQANRADPAKRQFFHQEGFRGLHSFLTHASNVSRLFWPPLPQRRQNESTAKYTSRIQTLSRVQRATALREAFELLDSSPLKTRTLRDHLEHFDERLDDWRDTSQRRNIVNDMIGPMNAIVGIELADMFRCFDPNTKLFVFRGEQFNIQELATEVDRLLPLATRVEEQALPRPPREA